MNAIELVNAVTLKATGKKRDLTPSDTKYQKIFAIANVIIPEWQSEPDVDWDSMYDPMYEAGNLSDNVVEIDRDEIYKVSQVPGDTVTITSGARTMEIPLVPAQQLRQYEVACAVVGQTLKFKGAPAELGSGSVTIPVYMKVNLLTGPNSRIEIDNPLWLVNKCAAEYIKNDVSMRVHRPDLLDDADIMMDKMKDNNDAQEEALYSPGIPGIS